MRTINRNQLGTQFDLLWQELEKEFFKVEVLQDYREDDYPSLDAFRAGDIDKGMKLLEGEAVQATTWAKGKENILKRRVHVVDLPLSPYMRWEIEWYKRVNVPIVGEQVFIVTPDRTKDIKLPEGDTMIFDDRKAISNIYEDGLVVRVNVYEDLKEAGAFVEMKEQLLSMAIPLTEFKD